jgi:hypothetical protein
VRTENWEPCQYCKGQGFVVTKDDQGITYRQVCPVCTGDKGFGSVTWDTRPEPDPQGKEEVMEELEYLVKRAKGELALNPLYATRYWLDKVIELCARLAECERERDSRLKKGLT